MRDKDRPHQPDGRRFTARYDHPVALELGPGESRTVEVAVPLAAGNGGPDLIDRMTFNASGATLHFGDQWYVLSVAAPVEGASASRTASAKLKASGRLGDRHVGLG